MKQALEYLKKLLKDKDSVVVGVSTGPDSMALLYLLMEIRKKTNINIVCAHVNHNVRKESKDEAIFLEDYCKKNDIVFEAMKIEKYGDDNFHNEARTIRYDFFEGLVKKYNAEYLMTAHHGDDLMETILMRLVRGSTLRGYGGFDSCIDKGDYKIVRPLIYATKDEIEQFDIKKNIPYFVDSSNKKDKYTRNRFRHVVLPFLKEEDKNVHEKFIKFSKTIYEYDNYINSVVDKEFPKLYVDSKLNLDKYMELPDLFKDKVLYNLLEDIYSDDLILVNDRHIDLIKKLIDTNKKNTYVYLPNNIKIVKTYNILEVIREGINEDSYNIEVTDYVELPNGKHLEMIESTNNNGNDICRLDSNDIVLPLHVRTRKDGDKMSIKNMDGHKKIKDILIDSKISMKDRDKWPVVVDSSDTIVWLPGLKKSKFNKTKQEKCDIIIKYY